MCYLVYSSLYYNSISHFQAVYWLPLYLDQLIASQFVELEYKTPNSYTLLIATEQVYWLIPVKPFNHGIHASCEFFRQGPHLLTMIIQMGWWLSGGGGVMFTSEAHNLQYHYCCRVSAAARQGLKTDIALVNNIYDCCIRKYPGLCTVVQFKP